MQKNTVKWFHSLMRGIPQLTGQVGRMITILDALLVNGFGETSVTEASVVNKKLTLQIKNSETFERYSIVSITGNDLLRGEYRVEESSNTFIVVNIDVPDQSFTSNLTVRYAPLGWSKITLTTPANSAVYVPDDPTSDFKLYVGDNYACGSDVRIFKQLTNPNSVSNLNELIGLSPITSAGWHLALLKSSSANGTVRSYFLIGDKSTFYQQTGNTGGGNDFSSLRSGKLYGTGKLNRFLETDTGSDYILGIPLNTSQINNLSSGGNEHTFGRVNNKNNGAVGAGAGSFMEKITGDPGNDQIFKIPDGPFFTFWSGYNGILTEFNIDGKGIELYKTLAASEETRRGYFKGIYFTPNNMLNMPDFYITEGSGDLSGRLLLFKTCTAGGSNYGAATYFCYNIFDLTGPW